MEKLLRTFFYILYILFLFVVISCTTEERKFNLVRQELLSCEELISHGGNAEDCSWTYR